LLTFHGIKVAKLDGNRMANNPGNAEQNDAQVLYKSLVVQYLIGGFPGPFDPPSA
jgi:hypothetical protein